MPTWLVPTLKWGGTVLVIIAAVAIIYVRFFARRSSARGRCPAGPGLRWRSTGYSW